MFLFLLSALPRVALMTLLEKLLCDVVKDDCMCDFELMCARKDWGKASSHQRGEGVGRECGGSYSTILSEKGERDSAPFSQREGEKDGGRWRERKMANTE